MRGQKSLKVSLPFRWIACSSSTSAKSAIPSSSADAASTVVRLSRSVSRLGFDRLCLAFAPAFPQAVRPAVNCKDKLACVNSIEFRPRLFAREGHIEVPVIAISSSLTPFLTTFVCPLLLLCRDMWLPAGPLRERKSHVARTDRNSHALALRLQMQAIRLQERSEVVQQR